ncbi:hypothetical protein ACTXMJ_15445 [Arthrobacter rhombi]
MAEKEPTRSEGRRPIPRWVWVLVAVLLVVGLVAGVSVFYAKSRKDETTAPAPSSAPAAASGADGCIAGRDNDARSLIEGAKKQAQTDDGAASVAAGQMRYMFKYPWPAEKELTKMIHELWTVTSESEATDSAQAVRNQAGPKEAATAGVSFADARYIIEPTSTADRVDVTLAAQGITDHQLNGKSTSMTFSMLWQSGIWKLDDITETRTAEDVLDNGSSFVGGC